MTASERSALSGPFAISRGTFPNTGARGDSVAWRRGTCGHALSREEKRSKHAIDDAFISRQPGVGPGQHALAAVITLAAGIAAIVV